MIRTPLLAASTAAFLLFAASCAGGGNDTTSGTIVGVGSTTSTTASTTTTPPSTTIPPTTLPPITTTTIPDIPRIPLTGEPISVLSAIPDRPALAVKITNAGPQHLPQAGLNQADIVFEEIVEGGATRLAAVFHSAESDPVGPIRSGRAQDINLMLAFNRPLFAWSGGNPAVRAAVQDSDLVDLDAARGATGYYRRSGRTDPNNLYSSTEALWAQAPDEAEPPPVVLPYLREGEVLTGDPAIEIEVRLDDTTAGWAYDADSDRYYRRQGGQVHTTEDDGDVEQVWADNIVVMMADYGRNVFDGNPDAQVLGSNPVYVFTGGTVREGVWLRFAPTDRFAFFDNVTDLNEIGLQPGRTWIEIPRNRDGTIEWQ